MKICIYLTLLIYFINMKTLWCKQKNVLDDINDLKGFKKMLRTKNNVLTLFVSGVKECHSTIKIFKDAADHTKGQGTQVLLDCSNSEIKKLCKKLKISPTPFIIKHYKDGDYFKDYDRQVSVSSIVNFMRDPSGDLPWEEDPTGADVFHITDANTLSKFLRKESRPTMIMFYAPWCGYCKTLKPEYSAAATELKQKFALAAIDVNRPENVVLRKQYNISGFPTLLYFENGKMEHTFEGENNKDGIINFMKDPKAQPVVKPKEPDWSSETSSEIVHLTTINFGPALKDEKSVLVMFYAPWCGHCKQMKPAYEKAAETMKKNQIPGVLAALDATKESSIGVQYGVKGYPTIKYFANGEFMFDVNVRDADKIIEFMKNPTEPPPPPAPEISWDSSPSEVFHASDETFKPLLKKKKHVLVMFYAPWCGHCKQTKPAYEKAAEHFKDDPRVELVAVDCTRWANLCTPYNVKGYPTFKYFSYLKTMKDYSGGRKEDDFIKFLTNPEFEKEVKVEPFGDFPGAENVLILTDDNFEQILESEKSLLVMFYAPWCGHCTQMKPAYADASAKLAENKSNGKLGVLDCTVHSKVQEKFKIQGFPTLKYFENGVFKNDYSGKRTAEAFILFMKNENISKDEL